MNEFTRSIIEAEQRELPGDYLATETGRAVTGWLAPSRSKRVRQKSVVSPLGSSAILDWFQSGDYERLEAVQNQGKAVQEF